MVKSRIPLKNPDAELCCLDIEALVREQENVCRSIKKVMVPGYTAVMSERYHHGYVEGLERANKIIIERFEVK